MSAVMTTPPARQERPAGRHETVVLSAGASDAGRVRSVNQDCYFEGAIGAYGHLAVVADGMGGHISGEVASRTAVEALIDSLKRNRAHAPVALAKAAQAANVEVYNHAIEHPEHRGMGTTLTAVLIDDQVGLVGHVGDSRAYLIRDGHVIRLTDDHSWVADRVRQGLLSEDEASKHRYRNVITNAIGATPTFRLDVLHFEVKPKDVVVVVSDGISMLLSEPLLAQFATTLEPKVAVRRLLREANERGAPDNVTAVVLEVVEVAPRPKRYDLPERQLEASTVAIGDTLSGIRVVEDGFPANGPISRFRRHPWYPYYGWLLGSISLLTLIVF
ncbi:MAG TPA: protein phosphatase 2C domain-containing protein, partial [Trueperaceae bacterium]|nr:protein phosphatase 2C domain-containing protein [Trueperaceae bacterium]